MTQFEMLCYELYKLDWISTHITSEIMEKTKAAYIDYCLEYLDETEDVNTFEDCIEEYGYANGCIYACFEEFLDSEYQDKEYMKYLIGDNEALYSYYCQIIGG